MMGVGGIAKNGGGWEEVGKREGVGHGRLVAMGGSDLKKKKWKVDFF